MATRTELDRALRKCVRAKACAEERLVEALLAIHKAECEFEELLEALHELATGVPQ